MRSLLINMIHGLDAPLALPSFCPAMTRNCDMERQRRSVRKTERERERGGKEGAEENEKLTGGSGVRRGK